MIVKWGDILDNKPNYSYVAQINVCKTSEFFKYDITYPVLKLYDKYVYHDMYDKQIITNINNEIYEDIMKFKNNIKKQALEYKKIYIENLSTSGKDNIKYQYEVYINNEVTYDRNDIISIVITQYDFTGGAHGMTYLHAYNYNLLTGNKLTLRDIFKPDVDYETLINNFIHEEISRNPENYFKGDECFKGISNNQPFYIDDDGIVIYFGLYEIAPYYVGIPKFKMKFNRFSNCLNYN